MDYSESLERLADHPHIWRFRELCVSDPAVHAMTRAACRALVIQIAGGGKPQPADRAPAFSPEDRARLRASLRDSVRARRRAESCPYREACGCAAAKCYHHNRIVYVSDCIACLDSGGYLPGQQPAKNA